MDNGIQTDEPLISAISDFSQNQIIELENIEENVLPCLVEQGDIAAIKQAIKACPGFVDWKDEVCHEFEYVILCSQSFIPYIAEIRIRILTRRDLLKPRNRVLGCWHF